MTFQKRILREVKDANDYFLNWPVTRKVSLGDYCTFDGWNATFDWRGNVQSSGIGFEEIAGKGTQDESYASKGSVTIKFDLSSSTPASASLSFRQKSALAFQSFGGKIGRIDLDPLAEAMLRKIAGGTLAWHPSYLVVTEVYETKSFSSFISGERGAATSVIAPNALPTNPFNIADPKLGLAVSSQASMDYVSLAQNNAYPYFIAHRLVWSGGRQCLKRYGR